MDLSYDPDKALRATKVEFMFDGGTYTFDVHNESSLYTLMLISHEYPGKLPFHCIKCEHAKHNNDPCTVGPKRHIKDAAEESIQMHLDRHHKS